MVLLLLPLLLLLLLVTDASCAFVVPRHELRRRAQPQSKPRSSGSSGSSTVRQPTFELTSMAASVLGGRQGACDVDSHTYKHSCDASR